MNNIWDFSAGSCIEVEGSLNTNFNSERNFADVSNRCSSLLEGESEVSVGTPVIHSIVTHVMTRHNACQRISQEVCGST